MLLYLRQGHQGVASCMVEKVPSRDWQEAYRTWADHLLAGTAVSGGAAGAAGAAEAALLPSVLLLCAGITRCLATL